LFVFPTTRAFFLSCLVLLSATKPLFAQDKSPEQRERKNRIRSEFIIEPGLNILFTPTYVLSSGTVPTPTQNTGRGGSLVIKYIGVPERKLTLGVRIAMQSMAISGDGYQGYKNGQPDDAETIYARPFFQVGLQGHFYLPFASRLSLRISPHAGYGVATSNGKDMVDGKVVGVTVGNSSGWNAGCDVSLGFRVDNHLQLQIVSGYQHSWMRFYGDNFVNKAVEGFNISHIPVHLGVGIRF